MLADAQAAEARGDKPGAISLLKRVAELYRDAQNPGRALKMLPSRVFEERSAVLAPPSLDAWCSFCCRPKREVGPLVAGPTGTFICASCTDTARALLDGAQAPATASGGSPSHSGEADESKAVLRHQLAAWKSVCRADAKVALLLGPEGSGRTTLLAALASPGVLTLDLTAPLSALPDAPRVVIGVRAELPVAPLTVAGRPVYDTATLVAACGSWVPEPVLARVDAVGVLPPFDAGALQELAFVLGCSEGADGLAALAMKSRRPAQELRALIARLK
jgi:hypothetical protein